MRDRAHRPAVLLPVLVFGLLGALCALGSAVVTVLIPDGGQHAPRTSMRHDLSESRTIYVFTVRRSGYMLMSVSGPMPTHVADELDRIRSQAIPIGDGDPRPGWLQGGEPLQPQTSRGIAAGWPFLCVWGRTDRNVNGRPQTVHSGLAHVNVRGVQRAFPWRPWWLGFAGNVAFYGGAMLVLWYIPVLSIRRIRRAKGRCPNCAYPILAGAGRCSECGYEFEPAVAGSSDTSAASSASSAQTTSTFTSKSSSSEDK